MIVKRREGKRKKVITRGNTRGKKRLHDLGET